jgi:DNA-binding LacI/PurR family transcriptional regulator
MSPEASEARKRPNLAAVAALAGVSPSTASLAFSGAGPVSEATKDRVLAAAAQLGYAGPDPRAQSLRRGRSGIIGVVMEDRLRDAFRDPMNVAMLDGIADETGGSGAALLLLTDTGEERSNIALAPMDAVVLIGCSTDLDEVVGVLRQRGMPIVAIEAAPMAGVLAIGLDNRESSARAARHLRDLGHSAIGVVTLPLESSRVAGPLRPDWRDDATSQVAIERLTGVGEVFEALTGFVASESSIEAGVVAGLALLGVDGRPSAVIAQSDLLAVGVIRAAQQLGLRVPADVSVVGFDGIRTDSDYDLTTLVQPAVDKGRAAGRAVLEMLDGGAGTPVDFTSEFHRGGTTAAPSPVVE